MVIVTQLWVLFFEHEERSLSLQGQKLTLFVDSDKRAVGQNLGFWKYDSLPGVQDSSNETDGDGSKCAAAAVTV